MTEQKTSRGLALTAALAFGSLGAAQEPLDLGEADARDAAYRYLSVVEARFDCDFEEHAMWEIGDSSEERYVVQLDSDGEECDEALTQLVRLADREGRLIFRRRERVDERPDHRQIWPNQQVLIHEVDPDMPDGEIEEQEEEPVEPEAG